MDIVRSKVIFSLLASMLLILSLGLTSAVTTINTPVDSGIVGCGALTNFNVTSNDSAGGDPQRFINLTFYAQSVSTANNSWVVVGRNNSLNLTLLGNHTITAINLTGLLEDSNDYIFNVTAIDQTSAIVGFDTNTGLTVDCTVPVAPSSLTSGIKTSRSPAITSTVTGGLTTSCTIFFVGTNPGQTSYTMTHTGGTCSTSSIEFPNSIYTYYVRASDGTNTTDSSNVQIEVRVDNNGGVNLPPGGGNIPAPTDSEGEFGNIFVFVLVIGLIIFAITMWNRKR